ncbi:peroxiredoxin-like family protein [Bacteriovorax sp. Seq25_V]|uniref:peroxiredoxin-like family protein n=1 Tax=Bacteriovorax sp. Seq25_V TaxID=1201288 RepID=UPI00038A2057|nr:peroxiredoxin-like family protein [Bacteriovorax sp. Seq25_V]EQC45256.1 redoxin [Bacteriovorax sp. Seq25_V]
MKSIKMILIALVIPMTSSWAGPLQEKLDARKNSGKRPEEIKKIMEDSLRDLKDSGIEKKAVSKNMSLPKFMVGPKSISDVYKDGPVVVKFFRGSWCPYCIIELKEYKNLAAEFEKANCKLIVLSPDTEKENLKTQNKLGLPFKLYSDKDNMIAKKFGIAFKVQDDLNAVYKKFGIDLDSNQGTSKHEIPMPGTYVANKKGKITYAFIDADYTKRAEPLEVLKECKNN